ncbi:MAG: cadherin repeat domain-containing protein, partial [Rhodobacteraceae bacterium]|nr:cadherin repeat domain-containing protein [Paracoccaceae bacterium]
ATVTPDENNNVLVGTGGAGNPILSNGQNNIQVADAATVWVDPLNDPTPVEFGPADASCGDQTAHLPLTESWLTNLPDALAIVNKDYLGNDILWSNAPRGAVRGPSVSTIPTAATNILLSSESVPENATIGTVVGGIVHNGTLPATLSITADPDNKFDISGTNLVTTATFDRGVSTSHSVTIRVDNTAAGGGVYSKSLTITVAVPAAWLPSDLANLAIWLDPSDLSTMWQERTGAAATTSAAVGDPVGTIRDKSANGYYLTAASDGARPILRQSGSLYYLEFDGVNDRLDLVTGAMTQIAQPNFIGMTADFVEDGAGRFFDGGSGTLRHILAATGTTQFYTNAGSWAGPYTTRTPGTPQAVTTLFDGASSYIRIDAGAEQAGSVGAYPLQGFYLGGEYNGSNPAEMNLFSLVVNDGDLTSGERDNLDAYLASKGGI